VALAGGGVRRGAGGGGPAAGGKLSGKPSICGTSESISISGAVGISGGVLATVGRATGGGGTNTRATVFFWNKHDVVPNEMARISASRRIPA